MEKKSFVGFETIEKNGDRMVEFPDCPGAIVLELDKDTMKTDGINSFEELVQLVFRCWYEVMVDSGLKINDPSSCLDVPSGIVKLHVVTIQWRLPRYCG